MEPPKSLTVRGRGCVAVTATATVEAVGPRLGQQETARGAARLAEMPGDARRRMCGVSGLGCGP